MNSLGKTILASLIGGCISIGAYKALDNDQTVVIEKVPENYTSNAAARYVKNNPDGTPQADFSYAAEKVTPTVVHISSTMTGGAEARAQEIPEIFRDFFGDDFKQSPRQKREPVQATGSGVIISDNGYIVTNNHVIDRASAIEVTLYNKQSYKAKVIGTDPSTDLALIKIEATKLPKLVLGNSDDIRVGQWVLAVGNPFNLSSTVTAGIVSAKGRNINILRDNAAVESFIQTDAVVNPGNSGGALVNLNGELVGINTAIATHTGSYEGYSFAVPTNIVSKVVEDLISYGKVQRAFLGITIRDMNSKLAEELKLPVTEGVYVDSLVANGSAKAAGLHKGDIITSIDGKSVTSVPQLQEFISRHKPGDVVKVGINRKGAQQVVNVPLKNKAGNTDIVKANKEQVLEALSAEFEPLTATEKAKYKLSNGVKVTKLYPGKLSSETEIKEGFIITRVNKKAINTVNDLSRALENVEGGVLIEGVYPGNPNVQYYAFGM